MPAAANTSRPLGDLLAESQAAANILGRLTILRDSHRRTPKPLRFNTSSRLVASFSSVAEDDSIDVYTSFNLPPDRAVEYLRTLTPVTRDVFDGLTKQYKADAFTIAGVSDQRLLARIQHEVTDVIQGGGTSDDFQAVLDRLRTEHGATSIGAIDVDGVFQGLTQKAYSAGRYEQMTDESVIEALPFWQYWTVGDDRVRPAHRILNRFCARAIDPVWMKIYPPCGYGCRCSVVCLSPDEAPEGSEDGGFERLPALTIAMVPQPGYQGIFAAA